nr:uncharacterized protein LOC111504301 [Leptinotarsa decemlineata]XP_023014588.1 uncharacterized protein LOC111504301 [Leptinotarsa decemlineata]
MSIPTILNLEELLINHIDQNKKIVGTKITRLTAPGDNFGSEILKIDLVLNDKTGNSENLSVIAKLIPEFEFYQEIFNIQWTFKNERNFYEKIIPCLQQFQKEQGVQDVIDLFPKYYGSRCNLEDKDTKVDGNAVLILENLKIKGYYTENRKTGFDLPTSKLLLRDVAKFHAVPLALKLKRPQSFDSYVKPHMAAFQPERPPMSSPDMNSFLLEVIRDSEDYCRFAPQVEKSLSLWGKRPTTFREPYSTLIHNDLWVNNIMLRKENNETVACKFVDFQLYTYDSVVIDLFFFLFTSVRRDVLEENLDFLIEYYHQVFVETLSSCHCDTSPFSQKLFLEEMSACADRILGLTLFMSTFIVMGLEGGLDRPDPTKPPNMEGAKISDENKDKIFFILYECNRRGWLNF